MDKKEQILHFHRIDGLSLREISRRVGVNRKTVTRYIREYEAQAQADPEDGVDMCLASRPKYSARRAERTKLTEPVCAEIDYWLHENARRRQTGMRKQCWPRMPSGSGGGTSPSCGACWRRFLKTKCSVRLSWTGFATSRTWLT